MDRKATPADKVIRAFGGVRPLAREIDVAPSTVAKWRMPPPLGRGGHIPRWNHAKILAAALRCGYRVTEATLR